MYSMDILKTKGQLDLSLLTGCDADAADPRPKIVFKRDKSNQFLKKGGLEKLGQPEAKYQSNH